MYPEDRARQDIDRQLGQCGWVVQDRGQMNISAALGVAVREFPMLTGEVDYLHYVKAKPDRHGFWGRVEKSLQNTTSQRFSVAFHGLGNGRRLC